MRATSSPASSGDRSFEVNFVRSRCRGTMGIVVTLACCMKQLYRILSCSMKRKNQYLTPENSRITSRCPAEHPQASSSIKDAQDLAVEIAT
jgi:hypothetical protein